MVFKSGSEKETEKIGESFADKLKPGDVLCLHGDPGAGKSVFVRGLARGLGISAYITSPTFTLVNEYEDGRIPLFHFDAYRLCDGISAVDSGLDEYFYYGGICAVEWPENIRDIIPDHAYEITISRDFTHGDEYRVIEISREENHEAACD